MIRAGSEKIGQALFIPYLLISLIFAFLGFMGKDWYVFGSSLVASLFMIGAVIFEFIRGKAEKGYHFAAFASFIMVVFSFSKMVKTQSFITSGTLLVLSGALCYFCFVSLMPSAKKPHMSKAWKEKLEKDRAAKEAERAAEEAEMAKEEAQKAKFSDE